MKVLVCDLSILIGLASGSLAKGIFAQPYAFAVPDALYEDKLIELWDLDRDVLEARGLRVKSLDTKGLAQALVYWKTCPQLTLHDCFALAIAYCHGWPLLTLDPCLKALAEDAGVEVRDASWLMERLAEPPVTDREILPMLRLGVPEVSRASTAARKRRRVAAGPRAGTTPDLFSQAHHPPGGPQPPVAPSRR